MTDPAGFVFEFAFVILYMMVTMGVFCQLVERGKSSGEALVAAFFWPLVIGLIVGDFILDSETRSHEREDNK